MSNSTVLIFLFLLNKTGQGLGQQGFFCLEPILLQKKSLEIFFPLFFKINHVIRPIVWLNDAISSRDNLSRLVVGKQICVQSINANVKIGL